MVSGQREMMLSTLAYIYAYKCWRPQYIVVYKNYHCSLCTICRSAICIAHVVKFVLEEHHAPVWDQGHCALIFQWLCCERFLAAFSTCTFLCRRTTLNVYLRHRAFRSEQSRHGWKAINSFSLWLRTRSMSKCALPKNGRPSELNNTANAGRIVWSRNGRRILPAFLLTVFVAALAIAAIPQEKKEHRNQFGAD